MDSQTSAVPQISVLLPVHNGVPYIEEALRSVMGQTFTDIEIVVIDDGSTDDTPQVLARLAAEDPRIRVIRPDTNLRLPGALNLGLDHVRGAYVARMDADDICEPDRLARQHAYLEANPEITLIGCSVTRIRGDGTPFQVSVRGQDPFAARWMTRFVMPFRHPTFLFRRDEMPLRYDPACTVSEDYDILARLSADHKIACIPDVLLRYREHDGSLTGTKWKLMLAEAKRIAVPVQQADLSPRVFEALAPFRAAYYDQTPLDRGGQAALFKGLKMMIEEDARTSPSHRAWVTRQAAQMAAQALLRAGTGKVQVVQAFLMAGTSFMPALAMRFLETRRALPAPLRSEPQT
ncbi:glycosyltransferase family A protein [Actibacterium sp. 188UL27-1]|uniref:glycosyltransferase family 2 protein n=1 Tax=Actibacterium sp. 188UL27-1 TaxID=2786961 RepID=UPI00195A1351|nr:glycosyltransferase family A protein [Actibacterium sp. 188UL27-1]MBM7070230.1 glycosyltransferase family 2 protein [Actibacterium sp. 188UL27-1]